MLIPFRRRLAALILVPLLASCYGSFGLTKAIHRWNGEVTPNKWGQEAVFLVLVIIPVYEVCVLVDAIVLNSVEFWTGDKAFSAGRTVEDRDGSVVVERAHGTYRVVALSETEVSILKDGILVGMGRKTASGWQPLPSNPAHR